MDFSLSTEQRQLVQAVTRFIEREYSFDQRKAVQGEGAGYSEAHWQAVTELGWLAASFPIDSGGLGGSVIESMLINEQLGRGLILEPFLPMQLAGHILLGCPSDSAAAKVLPQLLRGELKVATALYEPNSRFDLDAIDAKAIPCDGGFRLSGIKTPVLFAQVADKFIVSARLGDRRDQDPEFALFLLEAHAEGIALQNFKTLDGQQAALLTIDNSFVDASGVICEGERVLSRLEHAIDQSLIGYSAEALGAMEKLLDLSIEFCDQRQQFGRPISQFQVLQHKMVDMYIDCQAVRSLLYAAAIKSAEGDEDASRSIAALKFTVAEKGRLVAERAVQLHGAMGFTEELMVGQYYKRLIAIAALFGDADFYLQRHTKGLENFER